MTVAYTMSGPGKWRSIVWCSKCGAVGFWDHAPEEHDVIRTWRYPGE